MFSELFYEYSIDVHLTCPVIGSSPLQYHWTLDEMAINNSHKYYMMEDGTLTIHNISSDDEGLYLCIVQNSVGEVIVSIYLRDAGKVKTLRLLESQTDISFQLVVEATSLKVLSEL